LASEGYQMKVAIVTPYHNEDAATLRRCHDSVISQTYSNVRHLMVSDGNPHPMVDGLEADHYKLPHAHADAGATPRAIAAISAFSQGYDAVGFIDADNYLKADHVELMVSVLAQSRADGVVATRVIHSLDDREMYVDRIESNGENMIDTNSWFLTRKALPAMTSWIVDAGQRLWSDRHFAKAVLDSGIGLVRSEMPTVVYVTRWAWHYQHVGWSIPDGAVWINQAADGTLTHTKHTNK
jgi:Glycosyl transferase family 2